MNDLCSFFEEHFQVIIEFPGPMLEHTQRLRFRVYCIETRFEDPSKYPDGRERDRYDNRSMHCLVRHKHTGIDVGTVRLVLPHNEDPLPIEAKCRPCFVDLFNDPSVARASTAEPSRLLLAQQFRRRHSEFLSPTATGPEVQYDRRLVRDRRGQGNKHVSPMFERRHSMETRRMRPQGRRILPHVFLILIRATLEMSVMHRIEHWVAAMEPALLRKLSRLGINFVPVGAPLFYGSRSRQPCRVHLPTMLNHLETYRTDVWEMITDRGRLHEGVKRYAVRQNWRADAEAG